MENKRITILDSVRVIAVIMVMCHHYYSESRYPEIAHLFHFGFLGVPLFFIISGFVISLTLERTDNYKNFIKKRYIRLAPAMLVCSTITFVFFKFFYTGEGYGFSKQWVSYLIANTFIDPNVFNIPSGKVRYYYLDNAYWSLWVEICFYSLIGALYFFFKKKYLMLYTIICIIGTPIFLLFYSSTGHHLFLKYNVFSEEQLAHLKVIARACAFFNECFWFLVGLLLHKLFTNKTEKKWLWYMLATFSIILLKEKSLVVTLFSIVTFVFLMIFVYKPSLLSFMNNKTLVTLGIASYAMYLIHYHLGVVLVGYLSSEYQLGYFAPIVVIGLVLGFGVVFYKFLERPITSFYRRIIL
ncbi:MAG: acyltransferase [Cruoricaptor ignavus]|nr:acyltransferase [Cruoricaptor ignavus]